MSEDKFVFESLQDSKTITDFLGSLTEGFEKKHISLSTNGDEIVLKPSGLLNFSVKAKKKGNETRLVIKVSWKDAPIDKNESASPLKIS